eukprot:scaffold47177_cov54-Phaeocystis_antarctica.AAC.1
MGGVRPIGDHDVGGLDVAVDGVAAVDECDHLAELPRDVGHLCLAQRTTVLKHLLQVAATAQLHHELQPAWALEVTPAAAGRPHAAAARPGRLQARRPSPKRARDP